ncbi:hypothetical protein [Ralstonia mojiangensis]|uniref:hypothetical protein n=1 Tax=Ralstonia mojiangensis TaxID=2953895 RepID=UPI0021B20C9D|nr:hypothetical protein [Ralstonia mojiangensis]MCT7326247.1 hypothetical protein [Ralstonia mojiangensis]
MAIAITIASIYAWPPILVRRVNRLWQTGIERDRRLIKDLASAAQKPFLSYHRCHKKRILMLLIALSTVAAMWSLSNIERHGAGDSFVEYLLAKAFCIGWIFFSIFAYGVQLGFLTALTNGSTRKIILTGAAVVSLVLGRFLAIEHLGKIFPIQTSALTQTLYVGAFIKTLAIIAFGVMAFAILAELEMLLIMAIDSKGKKTLHTASLALCHTIIILSSFHLFSILYEVSEENTGALALVYLAEDLDFTSNHMCDAGKNEKVLFMDGVPDKALAAKFATLPMSKVIWINSTTLKSYMPTGFRMVSCNPIKETSQPGWCDGSTRFGYCKK